MARAKYTPEFIDRFWSRVDRSGGPDSCWPWTGAINGHGYGHVSIGGKACLTHRVAFELARRPLIVGECALHTCDNRPCCNPAHLYGGSKQDNARDREAREGGERRRVAWREAMAARGGVPWGNGRAGFTDAEVHAIRDAHSRGVGYADLARSYGVTSLTIYRIVTRRRYKHV